MNDTLKLKGVLDCFERKTPKDKLFTDVETKEQEIDYFTGNWKHLFSKENLIVNLGYNTIANRITNQGAYNGTTFEYFAWGDGTTDPALTDTATTFYADCANDDTKAVTSFDSFSTPSLKQVWNCFVSSTENTVTSITKFALMNDDPGTVMFNEMEFAAISKDATKEFYFRYNLTFSQV